MATFNFNCPECGNLLSGEDEWRGMESECPYCQKNIIIPNHTPSYKNKKKKIVLTVVVAFFLLALSLLSFFLLDFSKPTFLLEEIIGVNLGQHVTNKNPNGGYVFPDYFHCFNISENYNRKILFEKAVFKASVVPDIYIGGKDETAIVSTPSLAVNDSNKVCVIDTHIIDKNLFKTLIEDFVKKGFNTGSVNDDQVKNIALSNLKNYDFKNEGSFTFLSADKQYKLNINITKINSLLNPKTEFECANIILCKYIPKNSGNMLGILLGNDGFVDVNMMSSLKSTHRNVHTIGHLEQNVDCTHFSGFTEDVSLTKAPEPTGNTAKSPKKHVNTDKMSLREKCHYFYKHNAEDNAVNRKLLKAASARDIIAFDEALKEGASLFAKDAYGRNALDILELTNSTKTIEKVLETWYRENHRKICETTDTMTVISIVTRGFMQKHIYEELKPPLFYCKTREIAEVLLLAGAEINYQTPVKYNNSIITIRSGGDTALHFQLKNPEIVEFLLKNGANPNYADCDGRTPIFYTASPEIIDLLIRYKANINYTDHNGRTPLFSSNIDKIKKLISNGAKLNVCDKNGNTLCHYVAEFHPDNIDLYNFFIRSGVNPKAKNQHNESAYDKCKKINIKHHYFPFDGVTINRNQNTVSYYPSNMPINRQNGIAYAVWYDVIDSADGKSMRISLAVNDNDIQSVKFVDENGGGMNFSKADLEERKELIDGKNILYLSLPTRGGRNMFKGIQIKKEINGSDERIFLKLNAIQQEYIDKMMDVYEFLKSQQSKAIPIL